jgi:L-galactose dehydrogenase
MMWHRLTPARYLKPSGAKRCVAFGATGIFSPQRLANIPSPARTAKKTSTTHALGFGTRIEENAERVGTNYFDLIHIDDIEYDGRKNTEWALTEGYESVLEMKREGRIGGVSFGIHPMDLWVRIFSSLDVDAGLVHNHYFLNDTRITEILPLAEAKGIGIINASPFGSALLTDRGPAAWHPATSEDHAVFKAAADFCRKQGTSIANVALQFASQNPELPTCLFSSANPESVRRNVQWHEERCDLSLVAEAQNILEPVRNKQWNY